MASLPTKPKSEVMVPAPEIIVSKDRGRLRKLPLELVDLVADHLSRRD